MKTLFDCQMLALRYIGENGYKMDKDTKVMRRHNLILLLSKYGVSKVSNLQPADLDNFYNYLSLLK